MKHFKGVSRTLPRDASTCPQCVEKKVAMDKAQDMAIEICSRKGACE